MFFALLLKIVYFVLLSTYFVPVALVIKILYSKKNLRNLSLSFTLHLHSFTPEILILDEKTFPLSQNRNICG
jgi:hypothetical protein